MKQTCKLFLAMLCWAPVAHLQAQSGGAAAAVQPKIMVIPYTKKGEDIRTILEDDVNKRIALAKIKEAFDSRGFTTVDFTARIKAMARSASLSDDSKTDIKTLIIQQSAADIYVEAEIDARFSSAGNSAKIIMTAYDAGTGSSLSNKVGESGRFLVDDVSVLVGKAADRCMEDFLNVMQAKFTEIADNGKSIYLEVNISENSAYTMSSEVGAHNMPLSDEVEEWVAKNAYKNQYTSPNLSEYKLIFDDIRIPLRDPDTGNSYNPNKFGLAMLQLFRSLGLKVKRTIDRNKLFITIQ
ncbi:MAG: DUF6175 family protein [Prevotellaceae bacterium]|jgi:hypothetical protein|nr:DUF6175 family protein [Prevotellaceae bacterium]